MIEAAGGGSGRHVLDLAKGLAATGRKVHVVYSPRRMDAAFAGELAASGAADCHALPMHRAPHPDDVAALILLRRYLAAHDGIDVIHGHSSKAGTLARLAALGMPAVRVYTPHAFRTLDPTLGLSGRVFYGGIEVVLARCATDAIIAVSEEEKEHCLRAGVPADRLHLVLNGLAPARLIDRAAARARYGVRDDEVCIGFVGRLTEQKAPERLIEAAAVAARVNPRIRVVMLGSGHLEGLTVATASRVGMADRLVLRGGEAGAQAMPGFDIFAMPSRYEAMPYVLLEALAAGVPIVATAVGGTSATIEDGVNGFVVPEPDTGAFAARLAQLVVDPGLRRTMSAAARIKARNFTAARMVQETLSVYRHAHALRLRHTGAREPHQHRWWRHA